MTNYDYDAYIKGVLNHFYELTEKLENFWIVKNFFK